MQHAVNSKLPGHVPDSVSLRFNNNSARTQLVDAQTPGVGRAGLSQARACEFYWALFQVVESHRSHI